MEEWRQTYMSNRLASINIFTPRYIILNAARLPYHTVKPLESNKFVWSGRTSNWEQINWNTISKRWYSDQFLDSEINRAINTYYGSSSSRSNRRNSNCIFLVVTYHPNLPKLERTIRRYHYILQDSDRLQKAFPSLSIIAFRGPRNLHDLLVRANITSKISGSPGNFRCEARCNTCVFP